MIEKLFRNICYESFCIERGYILLVFIPLFFFLIFILYRDFVKFRTEADKKKFRRNKRWFRFFILITRSLIFFLILCAFALPFTTEEVITHGDEVIKLLVDNTESMQIFSPEIVENVREKLDGEMLLDISQISAGKRSELGEGILRRIEGNDNLLIITDGKNHFGKSLADVGIYASMSDTRLFALNLEAVRNDAYVEISGPAETIAGTQNRFKVKVNFIGAQPAFTLQILIDDKIEFAGQNIFEKEIIKSFSAGYHKIVAKITLQDYFGQNNVFYKTVKAVPKPKVLFISRRKSALEEELKNIYELTTETKIPASIDKFSAIAFNDIPYSEIEQGIDDLTGFLMDGGGLIFIGGRHSFDRGEYKGTLLESMLPVKIGSGKVIQPLKHNIVITLDVSDSFSDYAFKKGGTETALDLGKGMAVKMVEGFRDDINVGIVAFASIAQMVSPPVELKDNRLLLSDTIAKLRGGQGTSIDQGLIMAERALDKAVGTKNVILITDGKMGHVKEPHMPKIVADRMAKRGIKIYTVGLPSALYDMDINRQFLINLAAIGNGNYFEPTEYQYLNVFFGKPEEKEKIFSGNSNLAIMDKNHFITNELDLNAQVTGINFVVPKMGVKELVFTGDGNPVLNSWNFGLGRVITLATDDGSEWAGSLLQRENSMLLTRIINYAVGNPEKDKEMYVDVRDGFLGEENDIVVRSEKYPGSKDLTFTKEGENLYTARFSAENEGFYQFFDSITAINPAREYYDLGMDAELELMTEISGGKMLNLEDNDFMQQILSYSERKDIKRKDLKLYPLTLALFIFIIELVVRKILEHKKYEAIIK